MKLKALALVFTTCFLFNSAQAQDSIRILDFVNLGTTDKLTLEQKFKERGCQISVENNLINVQTPCFNLPQEKLITVALDDLNKVDSVVLTYGKSETSFELYKNALTDRHGVARIIENPYLGNKVAIWDNELIHIELNEPHLSFDGEIVYITQDSYKKYVKEQEQLQKAQENIKSLL